MGSEGRPMAHIRDALVALWEASHRICGNPLEVFIPKLLPSLEQHGRLKLDQPDRALVLGVSGATIDRLLFETKTAVAAVSTGGPALIRQYGVKFRSGVQRLAGSAARVLRGRHDGLWRHIRGWLIPKRLPLLPPKT